MKGRKGRERMFDVRREGREFVDRFHWDGRRELMGAGAGFDFADLLVEAGEFAPEVELLAAHDVEKLAVFGGHGSGYYVAAAGAVKLGGKGVVVQFGHPHTYSLSNPSSRACRGISSASHFSEDDKI